MSEGSAALLDPIRLLIAWRRRQRHEVRDARAHRTGGCTLSASVALNATKPRSTSQRKLEAERPAGVEQRREAMRHGPPSGLKRIFVFTPLATSASNGFSFEPSWNTCSTIVD